MTKIRVASVQYYIRPVETFEEFQSQVEGLVATAADYGARLVVFPEYFTIQLLTTIEAPRKLPVPEQVRKLAGIRSRFVDAISGMARKYGIYVVAGSLPTLDDDDGDVIHNDSYLFSPSGRSAYQGKLHMTRWEKEEWLVSPRDTLRVFETDLGKIAINICYDVEFPELARVAARQGVSILVVPSCTDERQGFLRVRYCAQARAIENQLFVIHSGTVGSLPMFPAVSLNYGQASILTPSDFSFARDGILAEGLANQESMIIGDLNLDLLLESREKGTVLPLTDSQRTDTVKENLETVTL